MMNSAARSLTDWPGFMNSALPKIVHPVASEARLSLISGVRPIAPTMLSQTRMEDLPIENGCRAEPNGDGKARQARRT